MMQWIIRLVVQEFSIQIFHDLIRLFKVSPWASQILQVIFIRWRDLHRDLIINLLTLFKCLFHLFDNIHEVDDDKSLVLVYTHLLRDYLLLFKYRPPALILLVPHLVDSNLKNSPRILLISLGPVYICLNFHDLVLHQKIILRYDQMVIELLPLFLQLYQFLVQYVSRNICFFNSCSNSLYLQ